MVETTGPGAPARGLLYGLQFWVFPIGVPPMVKPEVGGLPQLSVYAPCPETATVSPLVPNPEIDKSVRPVGSVESLTVKGKTFEPCVVKVILFPFRSSMKSGMPHSSAMQPGAPDI